MKNSEYWEKRIANNTWETYNSLEEKNRALLEMYQEASLNISDELYRVAEKMKTSTPTLSDMHKFNRLTNLQKNMENIIRELGENVEKFGKDNMIEGFKDTYSNVMAQLGITEFDMVPKKIMEEMMKRPWQGGTFSERLWKNTQVLAMNLNDIVTNGITQGKTVTEMAIQLNNAMNNGFNVSHRLVRTETMHYLNESAFKGYKDAGVVEVELWAAADERTCEVCGAKHGTKYKIKDRPILPLHANCRCTYLPVIENIEYEGDHKPLVMNLQLFGINEKNELQKLIENGTINQVEYNKCYKYFNEQFRNGVTTPIEVVYNDKDRFIHIARRHKNMISKEQIDNIISSLENPNAVYKTIDKFGIEGKGYIKNIDGNELLTIVRNGIITSYYPSKSYINKIKEGELIWAKR